MPSGGMVPLSWWFLVGSVLASASSVILIWLVWVKSTVDTTMELISSTKTSYIISSFLVCPAMSGLMAELMGKFPVDSSYSESPLLPPYLYVDMTSLSGSTSNMGDAAWSSIVCAWFEFLLLNLTAAGVVVAGVMVLVGAWALWEVFEPASKAGYSFMSMRTFGENSGMYG